MKNFKVKTIDFNSKDAPENFVLSLKNTGFAVIKNHPISLDLINSVYLEWSSFFNSKTKFDYKFDIVKQDGYFPMLSENAKGYNVKDLKEFYHIYLPWGRIPKEISNDTIILRNQLVEIATKLLHWIDAKSPDEIKKYFSIPLRDMIKGSQNNLLRVLHYPPLDGNEDRNAVRAAAHGDINLITVLISGSEPGLQLLNKNNHWIDVDSNKGWLVINAGDMLNKCSNNHYPSTIHRVINPKTNKNISRFSMPLFLHPRDEVILNNRYTAKSYLDKRLQELGLK